MRTAAVVTALVISTAGCAAMKDGAVTPPGDFKSARTGALELGAKVLQPDSPLEPMNVYLVGFHPMKHDPAHQMEAHHFCHQVNEDFAQCALFDGNTRDANLTGIEYIISEKLFETLPVEEREYWHPHNYEILSGQLVAPGIPAPVEKQLMASKMNSYGKTWHVWSTGGVGGKTDRLPLGDPMLAWSFNRDGEDMPGLVEARDRSMGVSTADKRRSRADLTALARPQEGVNDLKGKVSRDTRPLAGVVEKDDTAPMPAAAVRPSLGLDGEWKGEISAIHPVKANDLHATTTLIIDGEGWRAETTQRSETIKSRGRVVPSEEGVTLEGRVVEGNDRVEGRDVRLSLRRGDNGDLWGTSETFFADLRVPAHVKLHRGGSTP